MQLTLLGGPGCRRTWSLHLLSLLAACPNLRLHPAWSYFCFIPQARRSWETIMFSPPFSPVYIMRKESSSRGPCQSCWGHKNCPVSPEDLFPAKSLFHSFHSYSNSQSDVVIQKSARGGIGTKGRQISSCHPSCHHLLRDRSAMSTSLHKMRWPLAGTWCSLPWQAPDRLHQNSSCSTKQRKEQYTFTSYT